MHTYRIMTLATGLFDEMTVGIVAHIVRQGLEEDDRRPQFKMYCRRRVAQELDSFRCEVDATGHGPDMVKSYFINVWKNGSGKKHILMGAEYIEMVNLSDMAAYAIAKEILEDDVEHLVIPETLQEHILKYIGCTTTR